MQLIFDGGSLMYRMVYAQTKHDLSTPAAGGTGALFFLAKSLRSYIQRLRPSSVLMVLDAGYSARRMQLQPSYKAGRGLRLPGATPEPQSPEDIARQALLEDIRKQRAWAERMVPALGIRKIKLQGREADDIIAKVVAARTAAGLYSIVVSDDNDMLQLVSQYTDVYRPRRDDTVNTTNYYEITGCTDPEQWLTWKCLVGDGSDNVPGVPGCGDKTALTLVQSGLTLDVESLLATADHKLARARAVADNLDTVLLNKELLDLYAETFEPEQLARIRDSWAGPKERCNVSAVQEWFTQLGFRSILPELPTWVAPFQDLT